MLGDKVRRALAWFGGLNKSEKFLVILGALAVVGTLLSVVARQTVVVKDDASSFHVALIGPMSGPSAEIGRSMERGARLFVTALNQAGGVNGSTVVLDVHDDRDDPAEARRLAEAAAAAPQVIAAVGHWSAGAQRAAAEIYEAAGVPLVSIAPGWPDAERRWVFNTVFDARGEARFLSNYARNILDNKLMSVVVEDSEYGTAIAAAFDETFRRFGNPQFRWSFSPDPAKRDADIARLVETYKQKRDEAGALFLAADEVNAPLVVKAFRDAGFRPLWVGPSRLATNAFASAFDGIAARGDDAPNYTNGIFASAPLVFDTANEAAQEFKAGYRQSFGAEPDWVAAYAHDALKVVAEEIRAAAISGRGRIGEMRTALRDQLAGMTIAANAVKGITGAITFQEGGGATNPVQVAIYNGSSLISALTQLQPIPKGAVSNYIDEVRKGRVLYVNDRFMYRTNVVYVGLQVHEIADLDLEKETASVEFSVWFRSRGGFDPQDLVFTNATTPIKFEAPVEETPVGDMTYRLYRIKGKFNLNFSGATRVYGTHIAGVSFRHRSLNRNNVLYVVDVLGMPSGSALKERMIADKVVAPGLGWEISRAWVSQEVAGEDALGAPKYVGHGSIAPDFSKIDLGIAIKKGGVTARDIVPTEWFIYLAIFGALASVFSVAMDTKKAGRFWWVQSYGLRLVFWPLLLLAAGNLILDWAYQHVSLSRVYLAVTAYDILWWVVPARLLALGVRRFVWIPVEEKSRRPVPNVVKMIASFLIYVLALLAVVAFVFNEAITSLLATSGLLAMIIGLAIQANLSNVFSGIVLNMERPFGVGDWVKIGAAEDAKVTDVTWRTTRLLTRSGMTIAIPNAKTSEAQIINYSMEGKARLSINLYIDPSWEADQVRKALWDAPLAVNGVLPDPGPGVHFDGVVSAEGEWLAQYSVHYWISDYAERIAISGQVWDAVFSRLKEAGIPLGSSLASRGAAAHRTMRMGVIEDGGLSEEEKKEFTETAEWEFVENEFQERI
ncbi:MAG: ABC transporter substrate-binding protein [Magnetospirillum sp.]|nr:ABC transporter substrate-binding protein [Magnetospirillum sp.]